MLAVHVTPNLEMSQALSAFLFSLINLFSGVS